MILTFNGHFTMVKTKSKSALFNGNVVFNRADKVLDEPRGFLYYDGVNGSWVFCGLKQRNFKKFENLVLLLESPHKDEFDPNGNPLRPANGSTGVKINNLLVKQINPSWGLKTNVCYCVWLVNAIQYQTSAYHQLHSYPGYSKAKSAIRNAIFRTLWLHGSFGLQTDLMARLASIAPAVIVNCVTGGKTNNSLRSLVNNVAKATALANHPSSWH